MNIQDLLNKELSYKEMDEWLGELMGFSCNNPEDSSERFELYDEDCEFVNFREYIGMKPLNTLYGILFLKEKIDEERGEWRGRNKVQSDIKKALGIN